MRLVINGHGADPDQVRAIRSCLELGFSPRFQSWIDHVSLAWNEEGDVLGDSCIQCVLKLRFRNQERAHVTGSASTVLDAVRQSVDRANRLAARKWASFQNHES